MKNCRWYRFFFLDIVSLRNHFRLHDEYENSCLHSYIRICLFICPEIDCDIRGYFSSDISVVGLWDIWSVFVGRVLSGMESPLSVPMFTIIFIPFHWIHNNIPQIIVLVCHFICFKCVKTIHREREREIIYYCDCFPSAILLEFLCE